MKVVGSQWLAVSKSVFLLTLCMLFALCGVAEAQQLKNSRSRELSDLEFTVLIYLCLGVTNDGVSWLLATSRQSVERILGGLYRKLGIPSRRGAPQAVPTLVESRTRLCCEAMVRGLVNPHLLREEDAELRQLVRSRRPKPDRLFISPDWLDADR